MKSHDFKKKNFAIKKLENCAHNSRVALTTQDAAALASDLETLSNRARSTVN